MHSAQKALFELKTNDAKIKFNGKLEIPKDSVLIGKELDKVDFMRDLKTLAKRFGLESFFHMPVAGKMKSMLDEPQTLHS